VAGSPRGDVEDLCKLISKDPMLSTRILKAANSAAYASARGHCTDIPQAVRKIGFSTVRNIAAAIGIYNAMPAADADGFSPIRCWQHSFATAAICEHLARQQPELAETPGIPYMAGLCHDLGEILFHSKFGAEYRQVLEAQHRTARPPAEVEIAMLGVTRGELSSLILKGLALPAAISAPIEMLHAGRNNSSEAGRIVRLLRMADFFANGMLLASGSGAPINSFTQADCRSAVGSINPTVPDVQQMCSEIFVLTGMLARLSADEEARLMKPMYDRQSLRLCLVRDPGFSTFDPLATALESMANLQITTSVPAEQEMAAVDGLIVTTQNAATPGLMQADLRRTVAEGLPVFWLVAKPIAPECSQPSPSPLPTTLAALAAFLDTVRAHAGATGTGTPEEAARVAAA
jgi:HD-like signal output (HDOD) protein